MNRMRPKFFPHFVGSVEETGKCPRLGRRPVVPLPFGAEVRAAYHMGVRNVQASTFV